MKELEVSSFAKKMYCLLHSPKYEHLVGWCEAGETFIIKSQKNFQEELFPAYFKNASFNSYVRQLNMYGFKRISDGRKTRGSNLDSSWFEHPSFKRNREDLLVNINRISNQGKKNAQPKPGASEIGVPELVSPKLGTSSQSENNRRDIIREQMVHTNNHPHYIQSSTQVFEYNNRSTEIKDMSRSNNFYDVHRRPLSGHNEAYNGSNRIVNHHREIYQNAGDNNTEYNKNGIPTSRNITNSTVELIAPRSTRNIVPNIYTPRNLQSDSYKNNPGANHSAISMHDNVKFDGMDYKSYISLVDQNNEFSELSPAEYYGREREIHTSLINYLANNYEHRIPLLPKTGASPPHNEISENDHNIGNNHPNGIQVSNAYQSNRFLNKTEITEEVDDFVDDQNISHRNLLSQVKVQVHGDRSD